MHILFSRESYKVVAGRKNTNVLKNGNLKQEMLSSYQSIILTLEKMKWIALMGFNMSNIGKFKGSIILVITGDNIILPELMSGIKFS